MIVLTEQYNINSNNLLVERGMSHLYATKNSSYCVQVQCKYILIFWCDDHVAGSSIYSSILALLVEH